MVDLVLDLNRSKRKLGIFDFFFPWLALSSGFMFLDAYFSLFLHQARSLIKLKKERER
jgi:hypothetical protein